MMKIVTHNTKFHTDDVFAVATLCLVLGKDNCQVIRTRDEEIVSQGDYVVDVGQIYDPDKNRFDHHQLDGAGERGNGIPYASFGLVWKKFGEKLCGSKDVFGVIDQTMVQPIDARDNGKDISKLLIENVDRFSVEDIVNQFRFTWKEEGDWDQRFLECVDWATSVLSRAIKMAQDFEEGKKVIVNAYDRSVDKSIIVLKEDEDVGREIVQSVLSSFLEPLYAVLYRSDHGKWQVVAVRKDNYFELRKPLPLSWRAKMNHELERVTGVEGSLFCHRVGFMCVAKTKEGAIALAQKALEA